MARGPRRDPGQLLRHAAFHLICPHEEILRVRRHLRDVDDMAAVAALEMAQAQWVGLDSHGGSGVVAARLGQPPARS